MRNITHPNCPFCQPDDDRILGRSERFFIYPDGFPVSPGHALVIPFRHVTTLSELDTEEEETLFSAVIGAQRLLDADYRPDGYNIGINHGLAGGQTMSHLHVHVIPRYDGDQADPRGGIRWIFPEKAAYWP